MKDKSCKFGKECRFSHDDKVCRSGRRKASRRAAVAVGEEADYDTEDLDDLLYQNLSWHIDRYLRELGSACQLPGRGLSDQPYRIKRYDVGQGFDWHIDNGSTETANRVIAAQWYLNDVEEGGETEFKLSGRRIRCVEGRLLFFPVQWTLVHRGRPPRSSPKYIATTFFTPRF